MAQRPYKPADMPTILAYLTVREPAASLAFYEKAFGFESRPQSCLKGPDGKIRHAEMRFGDAVIMMGPEGDCEQGGHTPATSGLPSPMSLYIYCENVDALASRAQAAGAKMVCEPVDMFWGDRMCTVADPDGYRWSFATNVGDFDPGKAAEMMGATA